MSQPHPAPRHGPQTSPQHHPDLQSRADYYAAHVQWAKEVGLPPEPAPLRRNLRLNPGKVAVLVSPSSSSERSVAALERAAHPMEVKAVLCSRGPHPLAAEMHEWTQLQEEDDCCALAKETQQVVLSIRSDRDTTGAAALALPPSKKHRRKQHTTTTTPVDDPRDVTAVVERLVATVPEGRFREAVREDATAMALALMRLCPEAPRLALQLEVIGHNRCRRWHQDMYAGRMLITYNGPSTWMVDDACVNFAMFEDVVEAQVPSELADALVVPDFAAIHKPPPNSVVLIKGNLWPGIERSSNGMGVVHKSPNMRLDARGDPACKRLALKVDLAYD